MGGASAEHVKEHLKTYYMVFGALAVLTVVTVGVSRLGVHLGWSLQVAIAVALLVAIIKGSLVACYFMHLISERGMVFWILGLCAVFFVVLMAVPTLTDHEAVARTGHGTVAAAEHAPSHH